MGAVTLECSTNWCLSNSGWWPPGEGVTWGLGAQGTHLTHTCSKNNTLFFIQPSHQFYIPIETSPPLPFWNIITSVANNQNPFPLYLVKLRNRALKFLVHFSLVCLGKYPKPMKSDHKWKSQSGGPFSILQACFGGHLGVVFCKFCNQKGFSEAFFSVFPAFTNRQNPFPVQMSGKRTGKGFWRFVP